VREDVTWSSWVCFFMKKYKTDDLSKLEIHFGPFIAIAGTIYLFFGEWIYNFYFGG